MTNQTPSTEQVRYGYRTGVTAPILPVEAGEAFDAWLAARDREVAAKAWEEGARTGWAASNDCGVDGASYTYEEAEISNGNPYRIEAGDE